MTSNNVHTARAVEYFPRSLQIAYTSTLCRDNRGIPPISLEGCDPPLTVMEADLVLYRVGEGGVLYFHHSYLPTPVLSGVVNVVVRQWNRIYGRGITRLTPYQAEDRYCPSVLIGTVYAANEVMIYGPKDKLYLEDAGGSVYEFSLSDIGTKIIPIVEEMYLVSWNRA